MFALHLAAFCHHNIGHVAPRSAEYRCTTSWTTDGPGTAATSQDSPPSARRAVRSCSTSKMHLSSALGKFHLEHVKPVAFCPMANLKQLRQGSWNSGIHEIHHVSGVTIICNMCIT